MQRLREAESRAGMRPLGVWVPNEMHKALVRLRAEEGIAVGEAVRLALAAWLARRRKKGGRS